MIRSILTYTLGADNNPPVLQEETRRVSDFRSEEVQACIRDLTDTLEDFISKNGNKRGISGLSATQIGVDLAISVVQTTEKLYVMINPAVIEELGQQRLFRIGCFSLFEYRAMVHYNDDVIIEYYDEYGLLHQEEFKGDRSCVIQHEIDHLHGLLLFERLPNKEKDLFVPEKTSKNDSSVSAPQRYSGLFNDYTDYRAFISQDTERSAKLIERVADNTSCGGSVLELGDGPSTASIVLSQMGYNVTCLQTDSDMLDMDIRISECNNASVKYYLADEIPDSYRFDTVFSSEYFQSLDEDDIVEEIKKWSLLCKTIIISGLSPEQMKSVPDSSSLDSILIMM
ncbi:MAG: peptide deformylase [Oscillospiraceae bacterium]|nr:peptide deformylase [Oscillospiraceae bacterium]